jgi:hypothetical protein
MISAEIMGFHQLESYDRILPPSPPKDTIGLCDWMRLAGDEGVLRLLGMRKLQEAFWVTQTNGS